MQYGEILSRAWDIIWRFKVLWIFGIFAGLGAGAGNNSANYRMEAGDFGALAPALITLLCVGGLILFVVLLVLNIISYVALSRGAWEADEGATRLTFGELWRTGLQNFWRVAGLLLLVTLLTILVVLAVVAPVVLGAIGMSNVAVPNGDFSPGLGAGMGLVALFSVCLCCLLIPLFLLVDAFVWQAVAAITNDRLTFSEGVGRAWDLVRANFGQQILMALILAGLRLLVGLALGLIAAIIAIPFGLAAFAAQSAFNGGGAAALVAFLLLLPFSILFNGIISAYNGTVWTLVYRRLTRRGAAVRSVEVYPQPPV